jgi:hypothetical protein
MNCENVDSVRLVRRVISLLCRYALCITDYPLAIRIGFPSVFSLEGQHFTNLSACESTFRKVVNEVTWNPMHEGQGSLLRLRAHN